MTNFEQGIDAISGRKRSRFVHWLGRMLAIGLIGLLLVLTIIVLL